MAASDILKNNVKAKLARGEVVASMTVRLSRSIEIARIAKTAGFDMLYIDLEHSPLTMDATGQICMACLDIGIMPAVRVPANTPDYISRILDAGALGDMGLAGQYDHPKVREIYQTVIDACRKHGKHCGVGGLASRPDLMADYVRMGARYVSTGTDLAFLLGAATARA